MHLALKRLIEANAAHEEAKRALADAHSARLQAALGLAEIVDEDERWQAALIAYREFGEGLSLQLAEAATGRPGKNAVSGFLVRAGRMTYQPKGSWPAGTVVESSEMTEWPAPDALEREIITSHIAHGEPYVVDAALGWGNLRVDLRPDQAKAYLADPTGALAARVNLTREQFVEWLSSAGSVGCEARTKKGEPCKLGVKGSRSQMGIRSWKAAKERGGYCSYHGG
ncbi:MAG: hypothetical protein WA840_03745 [Caulobacteraceae bacterium]